MGRLEMESDYHLSESSPCRIQVIKLLLMTVIFISVFTSGFSRSSLVARAAEPTVNGVTITDKIKQGWDSCDETIDLSVYKIPYNEIRDYYYNAFYSDSKYFYVDNSFGSSYSQNNGCIVSVKPKYIEKNKSNVDACLAKYNNALEEFKKGLNNSWSNLEKLIYINDYLISTCEYEPNYESMSDSQMSVEHDFDAYGALVNHKAVCEGYSKAFLAMTKLAGVPSYYVVSDALGHAWNIVLLNGHYYMIDVTWNDASNSAADSMLELQKYKFFLKSERWFKSTEGKHDRNDYKILGCSTQITADDYYYDDYFWSKSTYVSMKYVDGKWLCIDGTGKIIRYVCNGISMTAEDECLVDISGTRWIIPNDGRGYSAGTAMKIASYGDKLLYTMPKKIMMYDLKSKETSEVYTLTEEEQKVGCIYGLYVAGDGSIQYLVARSLSSDDREAGMINTVPVTFKASFVWNADYSGATVKISSFPIEGFSTTLSAMSSFVVTQDATCTETGLGTYTVSVDYIGTTYTESKEKVIEAKGHKEVKDAAVAPTCTNTGLTEGSHCSVCKMVIKAQKTVDALDHDWNEGVITTPSTCIRKGVKTFTCKRDGCNATKTEDAPLADHIQGNPVKENEVAESCTSSGSYDEVIYCTVCKAELSRTHKDVDVAGHIWDEGTVTTPAGCTTDGVKTFRCTRPGCNETREETIKAEGHKEVKDIAVAPTCTNTGLTEGSHCSVCKMVIKAQETVDALDHDWNEGVITTPSTCIRKGVKTFTCKRDGCNATKTEEVPLADHIQGKPVKENEVAESCTSSGSYDEVIYCTVCKAELSRTHKDVDVAGHSWDKGTVTTPAGCTTDGVKTFRCTRPGCNETKYETIKALGHNVVIDRAVVPTYTSTGLTQGSHCSKCKTVLVRQKIVPKLVSSDNGNQPANPENGNNPGDKVTKPGVGTISADGKALTDTEGIRYFVSEKLNSADVKNKIQVADQRAGLKYKITKITRKRGRIIAGNVTYLGPYNKNCTKAVIPDTIKICGVKFNVTAVNKNAFRKCKKLSKVYVGKYVSSIGEKCFFGCNNLKTVTVKTKRLKTVGKNAFKGINRKAVIRVPKNYIDKYTKLVAKGKAPKGVKVTK